LGFGVFVCFLAISLGGSRPGFDVNHYLVFYSAAFALYLIAVGLLIRRAANRLPSVVVIWTAAIAFRVALLVSPTTLSDDVYRYLWDGHLATHGVNPYAHAVKSPTLDGLGIPARSLVNNAWMASPYLPAAQVAFAGVALVAPQSPGAFQVVMTSFDLLAGLFVMLILRQSGKPPEFVLAYLWNPLVVAEFANGAHVDALMLALTLAALVALLASKTGWSALLLGLATLTKGLPALLLFAIWPRWRPRDWLVYAGVIVGLALPYVAGAGLGLTGPRTGKGLFGAIRVYGYEWNYNGGLYHWLEGLTTGVWLRGALPPDTPGAQLARMIAGAALALALVFVAWLARRASDDGALLRLSLAPFAAYLLLSTTVHPWYVTLLVPFIAFELAAVSPSPRPMLLWLPLLYWSWSVALAYLTYLDPANVAESVSARAWEYIPLYLMLMGLVAVSLAMRARRRNRSLLVVGYEALRSKAE
jgi:hypothetical protein